MTTISNNEKFINLTFTKDVTTSNNMYIVNLPTVSCNEKEVAEYLQLKINEYVNSISREILKK